MKRKLYQELTEWKNSKQVRKPIVLYGARQVGKTHLIKEFGKSYKDVFYINFEMNPSLIQDFETDLSPVYLLNKFETYFGKKIIPGESLIFFDEVQLCERALTSLKYFCENAPEYHVIAAGSLLGVAIHREKYSFPVGKVRLLNLYAFDFEEFLWACNHELLAQEIRKCFQARIHMSPSLHQLALEMYKNYLIVGGMPEAINHYLLEKRLIDAGNIQNNILNSYIADMAKYTTPAETTKILACFNSIPAQLAKDNRKFQYKVVQKGGSATIFGASLDWLSAAGIIAKCQKVNQGVLPLAAQQELGHFKIFMNDVGLLVLKSGVNAHDLLSDNIHSYIGAITENYAANALVTNGHALYYWESNSLAEIDFVIQLEGKIIPIEVKSNLRVKSRSLSVYTSKFKPAFSIRVSAKHFGFENSIFSIPLYAMFCIESRSM
ncbi:MAG: ATPase [Bdellovibrionales bacterium RIFOXYD1_FULL_53_11]|nr:MAG: ATPase [Bdellovibrionales bacterium RIFOXYD1_FULL_53_11]